MPTHPSHGPGRYEIRVKGHLDARWAAWFDGMSLTTESDGTTVLSGPVVDQSALHGLLQKVRDVGLPLVSVTRRQPGQPGASSRGPRAPSRPGRAGPRRQRGAGTGRRPVQAAWLRASADRRSSAASSVASRLAKQKRTRVLTAPVA